LLSRCSPPSGWGSWRDTELERLAPAIHPAGILLGAAVGFAAAIYLMVTGLRAYINSETPIEGNTRNKE